MSVRLLVVMLIALGAAGLAWQKRTELQAWAASAGASPASSAPLRKCIRGQAVSYSNVACPPGHTEQAVGAAPVTVLPATPVPQPADAAASGPSSLHKALDITRDETLRDKAMERAINGSR